jgi:release factor H-coupled RctB family protein
MESRAITQLNSIANLPGVTAAVGLPDLHAGNTPVGMVVETQGIIYPHLLGNDIGCGMGLFKTGVTLNKYSEKRWVSRLNHIRCLSDIETINPFAEDSPIYDLGTIGGGNHFAEFQVPQEIFDAEAFSSMNIGANEICLLIHSGSRGFGAEISNAFPGYDGLALDSAEAAAYVGRHELALLWARRNRRFVAEKLLRWLGYEATPDAVIDLMHNFIELFGDRVLHRKGAVSSKQGLVIIPGSRGSLTYIVKPQMNAAALDPLSHGAGRKWARSLCKSRIRDKYDRDSIRQTALKSKVVCHDTELLFQEAPEAYKNIRHIIDALQEHELIRVVAAFRPLITYKG